MQLIASNFLWKFEPNWPISSFTIGKYIHFLGQKQFPNVKFTIYCTLLFWNYDTLWKVFCVFVKLFMSYLMCLKVIIMHWMFAQKIVHIENLKFVMKMSPSRTIKGLKIKLNTRFTTSWSLRLSLTYFKQSKKYHMNKFHFSKFCNYSSNLLCICPQKCPLQNIF